MVSLVVATNRKIEAEGASVQIPEGARSRWVQARLDGSSILSVRTLAIFFALLGDGSR